MITKEDAEQHWGRPVFSEQEAADELEVSVSHLRWKEAAAPPSFSLDRVTTWYPCQALHTWIRTMGGFNLARWRMT